MRLVSRLDKEVEKEEGIKDDSLSSSLRTRKTSTF